MLCSKNIPEEVLKLILKLYLIRYPKMPKSWKSVLILPFNKPGKHRPIALTSHLCKWMQKILVRRINYFLNHSGLVASY